MSVNEYLRQSALAALGLAAKAGKRGEDAGVVLREGRRRAQVCLRGKAGSEFDDTVEKVLGLRPPIESGTSVGHRDRSLFWLGPDEWLGVFRDEDREEVLAELRLALQASHASVVDVSHARAVVSVSGRDARSLLLKGCHLDLHPSRFRAGSVAQSRFARCHVLLHQTDDAPAYDLYVQRSFARYLWSWLEDAAAEFGVAIEA